MKEKIIECIRSAMKSSDFIGTWFIDLGIYDGKRWAVVIAWMDWDNTGTFYLYGKIAYQPTNSIMQCDYDIDWIMPVFENGDVDDTEISINSTNDADYLLKDWNRVRQNIEECVYIYN